MGITKQTRAARFIGRGLIVFLGLLTGMVLVAAAFQQQLADEVRWIISAPPATTPLLPTILAPRGAMPRGAVGLQQWLQVPGGKYTPIERCSQPMPRGYSSSWMRAISPRPA